MASVSVTNFFSSRETKKAPQKLYSFTDLNQIADTFLNFNLNGKTENFFCVIIATNEFTFIPWIFLIEVIFLLLNPKMQIVRFSPLSVMHFSAKLICFRNWVLNYLHKM